MILNKRAVLNKHLHGNMIQLENGKVKAYSVPTGALCEINKNGNAVDIKNGKTRFVNDELSHYLYDNGVRGNFIIHHKSLIVGVPKWVTYQQHHAETLSEWAKDIEVYTFDGVEHEGLVTIKAISHGMVSPKDMRNYIDTKSKDAMFDGLFIQAELTNGDESWYHVLPSRYIEGRVIDYNIDEDPNYIVVEIKYGSAVHNVRIDKFTNSMAQMLKDYDNNIINRMVKLQYSTYIPGDRMENFSSLTALFVINQM